MELAIGGIEPFSTVDWPGCLSAVAFLAGCPWRCAYCQNHVLQDPSQATCGADELFDLCERRRGLLDAVVFSGGEPLAQEAICEAVRRVHDMGFEVGLHTCGAYPERLARIISLVDWVGFDVKAPWDAYERITGAANSGERALESLEIVLAAGIPMEARTTWHPRLLSVSDIERIADDLVSRGVAAWAVQAYRSAGTTGELPNETVYPSDVPERIRTMFDAYEFRRA